MQPVMASPKIMPARLDSIPKPQKKDMQELKMTLDSFMKKVMAQHKITPKHDNGTKKQPFKEMQ